MTGPSTDRLTSGPSKRAKSQRALDLVHGRKGGRSLPRESDYEQAVRLEAAIAQGVVVRVRCRCTRWLITARHVGDLCRACDAPMLAHRVVDSSSPVVIGRDDWTYADHALGLCVAGDGPCRSVDPAGMLRHPNCGVEA